MKSPLFSLTISCLPHAVACNQFPAPTALVAQPAAEAESRLRVFTALDGKDAEATWRVVGKGERLTLSGGQVPSWRARR